MICYKRLGWLLCCFLVWTCGEKKQPELLISDEKMIEILVDLHVAEAAILSANKQQKDSIGGIYFKQVFEMNEVTDSIFYKNLDLISSDPLKVEEIYEKVIEGIEQLDLTGATDTIGTKKK